jgi:hypothetical protein
MDLDDDDETQRARDVQDYGIEVDFSSLDEDEQEVSGLTWPFGNRCSKQVLRTALLRLEPRWTPRFPELLEKLRGWLLI